MEGEKHHFHPDCQVQFHLYHPNPQLNLDLFLPPPVRTSGAEHQRAERSNRRSADKGVGSAYILVYTPGWKGKSLIYVIFII